jgi:uncharacterized protein
MVALSQEPERTRRRFAPARWLGRALAVLAGLAVLAAAVVLVIGLALSAPVPATIGPAPADLAAEPVTFASGSGATLRGWLVAGEEGGGAVVLLHQLHSNRLGMVRRARLLKAAGFSVLLFDLQAHGESTGARISFGGLEGYDAHAAVGFVRQRLPRERIAVMGDSLGGAAALLGPGPLPVDALVLEAVYPDIGSAIANRIRSVLGPVVGRTLSGAVAPPATWMFELLLAPFVGVSPADLRPIDRITEVTAPVLLACGTRDERTTIAEARAMFERARAPKSFWAVEGAGHTDLEAFAPEEYRAQVLPFLLQHLRR